MPKDTSKELKDFSNKLKNSLKDLQPQAENLANMLQNKVDSFTPKGMKECTIDKQKASVIIYKDNAIRIEFADKDYGKEFYETLK